MAKKKKDKKDKKKDKKDKKDKKKDKKDKKGEKKHDASPDKKAAEGAPPAGAGAKPPPHLSAEYWSKVASLQRAFDSHVLAKRSHLMNSMHRNESVRSVLETQAADIEAQTRRDFEGVVARLQHDKSTKIAILDRDSAEIRLELAEMDRLMGQLSKFKTAESSADMTSFLSAHRELQYRVQSIGGTPARQCPDINPYSLPREYQLLQSVQREYEGARHIIRVKDEMIRYLLSERDRLLKLHTNSSEQVTKLNSAAKEEIKEWVKLTDRFARELQQFKKVCKYCGLPFTPSSANSYCKYNGTLGGDDSSGRAGAQVPEFGSRGSGLHCFVAVTALRAPRK